MKRLLMTAAAIGLLTAASAHAETATGLPVSMQGHWCADVKTQTNTFASYKREVNHTAGHYAARPECMTVMAMEESGWEDGCKYGSVDKVGNGYLITGHCEGEAMTWNFRGEYQLVKGRLIAKVLWHDEPKAEEAQ